jgi:hypothetical protein
MSIHGVNHSNFNPYARNVGTAVPAATTVPTAVPTARPGGLGATVPTTGTTGSSAPTTVPNGIANGIASGSTASPKSVADAIKQDAAARTAQVNSPDAPDGVDQDLWSVLTKEERGFFVKAGAMGPLTYGRFTASQTPAPAPIVRGGRLDIKA